VSKQLEISRVVLSSVELVNSYGLVRFKPHQNSAVERGIRNDINGSIENKL
jgi:hypothetical protein